MTIHGSHCALNGMGLGVQATFQVCIYAHIFMCMYVYMYVCMDTCINMHINGMDRRGVRDV